MSAKERTYTFVCPTAADTQALAAVVGQAAKGGEVIEFKSDLGGGKTAFVKGLARGMGVTDIIQSPTFVISQLHKATAGRELHHFDFYRLTDAGIMSAELAESLTQPNAVVAIEWGDIVHDIIPTDHMTITLMMQANDRRVIKVDIPDAYDYIRLALTGYQQSV